MTWASELVESVVQVYFSKTKEFIISQNMLMMFLKISCLCIGTHFLISPLCSFGIMVHFGQVNEFFSPVSVKMFCYSSKNMLLLPTYEVNFLSFYVDILSLQSLLNRVIIKNYNQCMLQ